MKWIPAVVNSWISAVAIISGKNRKCNYKLEEINLTHYKSNIKTMKTKLLLIILLSLSTLAESIAQESVESIIETFFKNYEEKGAEYCVQELYNTNPWTSRIEDAVNNIKSQLARFNEDLVGTYYGYEKIVKKQLGDSYVLYAYFMKFDRQFLRLTFQFYKPNDKWMLYSFQFDDNYDTEIEEAAKLYYLNLE